MVLLYFEHEREQALDFAGQVKHIKKISGNKEE